MLNRAALLVRHKQPFVDWSNQADPDPALWPTDRSLNVIRQWCSFELHTVVSDTGNFPLEDDET